jgi:HK97 family phage portal protein
MGIIRKAAGWLSDLAGAASSLWTFGLPSYSGKVVTPENSIQVPAIWCSMKILAETESGLPLRLHVRNADGSSPVAVDHPLDEILHDAPNPEMSAMDFRMSQTAQLALWGNCYSRIARNSRGEVIALWPLQSRAMQVNRDNRGELVYQYSTNGSTDSYAASDILHVRTLSFDGIRGISPITQLNNPVGLAMALEEFAGRFFSNGAVPAIALEHPARLGPDAVRNIRDSWKAMYGGNQHAHEVAVLEENMKIQVIGVDPQKSQSVESRRFQIGEIARIYRIPPHMLADLDKATFSNIEQQSLEFVIYTLMPWLELWEQAINRSLLTPADRKKYFAEHNVAGLLRGDIESRYKSYAIARNWGWMNANTICGLENLPPIGPAGDVYLSPLNMVPAGSPPVAVSNDPAGDPASEPMKTALKAALLALAAMSRN